MNKQIFFGLIAAIVAQIILSYLFSLLPISTLIQIAWVSFLSAVIGSYIAKRNFLVPMVIIWFLTWLLALYILFRASNGQTGAYALLEFNKVSMAVSLLAAIFGCIAMNIRTRRNQAATI